MMGRKVFSLTFLALVLFLFPRSLYPATDAKTADFLRKLNKYYYCVSREGLSGFICEGTLTVSSVYKRNLIDLGVEPKVIAALDGQKIKLFISHGEKPHLEWVVPIESFPSAFKKELESQVQNAIKYLQEPINSWYGGVFEPAYTEDDMRSRVCSVSTTQKGFVVVQKAEDGSEVKMFYDQKAKQYEVKASKNGKELISAEAEFISGPSGFYLSVLNFKVSVMDLLEKDHFTYQNVGKFFLLKSLVKEIQFGKVLRKGSSLTLQFDDYVLQKSDDQ